MATEIAKAYVQIVPSMQGIKGKLESALGGEADSAGSSAGKRIAGKIGSALGGIGKLAGVGITAGISAAATGISVLGKQAVEAYADFQQLEGGIETLFGEDAPTVMASARNAFQSAGLSANEYMETAIQSSASLISSLGGDTEAAASLMDLSITDMADNVNKMGTSMEAVQNAYRGFSRGNFTMLDNLALGYAGTKEGMQDLLDKAKELSGVSYDIDSYADIVQAIHVVQTEMGITGTTAKEGADTISGSINSMKAAWTNLLTGLADGNADIGGLISNLMTTVRNVAKNLIPVAKTVLKNTGALVKDLAPIIAQELPGFINDVLPDLIDAAVALSVTLGVALAENAPTIIGTLAKALGEHAPEIMGAAVQIIVSLATGIAQALPDIVLAAAQILWGFLSALADGVDDLWEAGISLVTGLWDGISSAADWLWDQISGWLGGIWGGIKGFFGIASPSKEMAWAGEMLAEGLASGITDSAEDAVSAATRMSADVLSAMNGGEYALTAGGAGSMEIRHSGTIRVEGVSSRGELVGVTELLYDQIVARLRREARYA